MRQAVTAIIMAVSRNFGVPLGFTFGVVETTDRYEQQYAVFGELVGLDFSQYSVESDQGVLSGRFALHMVRLNSSDFRASFTL